MPWAARKIGRPIKWTCERSEAILADEHARDVVTDAEIAFDAQGRILGLRVVNHANVGAYISSDRNLLSVFVNVVTLSGVYRIPAAHVRVNVLMSHCNSTAPYRGAGRPESIYTIERLLDDAATELGIDRVELRRLNIIDSGAFPYKNPFGVSYDCGAFDRGFERMLQMCDHAGFAQRQQQAKARGKLRGIGFANAIERAASPSQPEYAEIRFNPSGTAMVLVGTKSQGQGHETTFAKIAAEILQCEESKIKVVMGDSDLCPIGIGALASRSTAIAGSAIANACQLALKKKSAGDSYPIVVEEKFSTSEAWAYGCVIVQLHIDHQTGQPRLERIIWVDDAGNIVMPPLAHGQLVGGAAQGIGQALFEKVVYDSQSQLLTGSFMDYAIPRASDIPDIEIISLESASPLNPIGAKGVGEAGCIGIPAAIMNAAKDALSNLGEIDLQFPLTSEQLWLAIHHKETHHEI